MATRKTQEITTHKSGGRPAIEVSKTDLSIIEAMAKVGNRLDDIATALNISPSTLDRWLKLPEVDEAYRKGRAAAKHAMAGRLWDIAFTDDEEGKPSKQALTATIFWLKAQAN
ncbi:MAG: helix-turn-helix domain containing protein [Scytolyngbya sp. HA4215-MV1]|nr:helix-turn-helix domain containing protein [Scytolyngbya sp. HA4215-MV1]